MTAIGGKNGGDDRASQAHEHRIERSHGEPGRGKVQAEAGDADQTQDETLATVARRRCAW
jgi:hypothetical protein